ncbi:MAG: response regulator [Pseudomonadota bacterium]
MAKENIKLLIVDDEIKFLDSIAKRLSMRGLDVTKAANGADALKAAEQGRFDLALLDLKMPGMDGKQVLEILKRDHRYLEVIILTGHGSIDSAVECTRLGAFSYLPKPYELEKLIEVLQAAYQARLKKKFERDAARMAKLEQIAMGQTALGILRAMRELDDDER